MKAIQLTDAQATQAAATDASVVANYTVTGMTCGHCVAAVREEVGGIVGVSGVDVDLATGRLTVSSEAPIDFDRIVEAVLEAGDYTVE